ncbi:thylakoid lumenal 19 kDa protein, chloroplastic [Salvia miltiorrhiza]|uniref:thylakoid lumenal 19 kDa protein, chloroplastic n=1 Tax=Salvia miltiorrhiza TaxID=226208 RepID=UPI0025ACF3C0|nr:thylakoid lumenal 19 kDa protein, chloroplastic [Salvia miltiorrhiza]
MATIFSPSAVLSSSSAATKAKPHVTIPPSKPPANNLAATFAATALAATILAASPPSLAEPSYKLYYGTAASAANYGGFGGNSDKKASAEYTYDVPEGWKEKLISKIQKGTNGTDSEFYNPKKKKEREYLTFLDGFPRLAPKDMILNNLALSDVELQDLIAAADNVSSEERKDDKGQTYYVYEIDSVAGHSLISVTCARNKLYAHFVNAPAPDWNRDQETLRHIHHSFRTVD